VKLALAKYCSLLLIVGASSILSAHDVISTKITWAREISRVVYKRCASCHRDGGTAFSLMTYEQARPWAKAIKEEVLERRMPPFGAIKGFGELRDDQSLTQEELHLIADWVEGGAPEGEPSLLPKPPEFKKTATVAKKPGTEVIVDGALTLKQGATFTGVRATTVMEGGSLKAIAQLPDGSIVPLIWIYKYKPQFDRTYFFQKPLAFPAGTKIETYPARSGAISLLARN
jgi:hypothetical protein